MACLRVERWEERQDCKWTGMQRRELQEQESSRNVDRGLCLKHQRRLAPPLLLKYLVQNPVLPPTVPWTEGGLKRAEVSSPELTSRATSVGLPLGCAVLERQEPAPQMVSPLGALELARFNRPPPTSGSSVLSTSELVMSALGSATSPFPSCSFP